MNHVNDIIWIVCAGLAFLVGYIVGHDVGIRKAKNAAISTYYEMHGRR